MNVFDYLFSDRHSDPNYFLIGSKEQATFADLYSECISLAGYLQNQYGTGKKIILISHNNLFFIKAYLAILKSGNVVVPLNPAIEQENFDFIVKLCESEIGFIGKGVLIKTSSLIHRINDEILSSIPNGNDYIDDAFENNIAEIIFTSGSTGVPKGVVITHKNIIANTSSIIQYLELSRNDRMLVVLPFYYCYGLSLLHTHLKAGGSIVLNNSFIFLGGILRDLNQYQCTGFAGVPSHFQILLRKSTSFINTRFPALRYVTQAGGKLSKVFIQEFISHFPDILFYVMYGQTEATARLSYLPPEFLNTKLGSIGKGIPGTILKVVNEHGIEVKPGEAGEIIASGDNIMAGYYNDEELTATTIRDGWLYTGDIATIDEDGFIFISSRKKEIIKVGGKRVSIKEIEENILLLPEVVDCSVSSVEDTLLGEAIKAIVVLADDAKQKITVDIILDHCHKHLAAYKVPKYIEIENVLKISATGKKIKEKI